MAQFVVDLWLDGYDDEAVMEAAAQEFIEETLDFSGSSVNAEPLRNSNVVKALEELVEALGSRSVITEILTRNKILLKDGKFVG